MKTSEEWIEEIEAEIIRLDYKGIKTYYNILAEMTKDTANKIYTHFSETYEAEVKRCNSCVNKYDIIITWR